MTHTRKIRRLLVALVWMWALMGLWSLTGSACCHGGGGSGDHAPQIVQLSAPTTVDANTPVNGTLVWEDEDGDLNWVEFEMCQNVNINCMGVGGWNPNPFAVKKGVVTFEIACQGLAGAWTGRVQVRDRANHASDWRNYSFTCDASSTPAPPPKPIEVGPVRVHEFGGPVTIQRGNGEEKPALLGMTLEPGDVIVTGKNGWIRAVAQEDRRIFIGENSHIKLLPNPSLPTLIGKLVRGVITLIVGPKRREGDPLEVQASYTTIGIRGTTLTVISNPEMQQDTIIVEEGIVEVTPTNSALAPFTLEAGQQVEVGPDRVNPIMPIGGEPSPSPPLTCGGKCLKNFDRDDNDLLEDDEFFALIDAWIEGRIEDAVFFQGIDLWISQQPISSAKVMRDTITLRVNRTKNTMTFEAHGQGIASMGVEIFNLHGQRIFFQQVSGTRLRWNWMDDRGHALANGVYLSSATVRGPDSTIIRRELKKLVVLR
jgi:hypothetical protein